MLVQRIGQYYCCYLSPTCHYFSRVSKDKEQISDENVITNERILHKTSSFLNTGIQQNGKLFAVHVGSVGLNEAARFV